MQRWAHESALKCNKEQEKGNGRARAINQKIRGRRHYYFDDARDHFLSASAPHRQCRVRSSDTDARLKIREKNRPWHQMSDDAWHDSGPKGSIYSGGIKSPQLS